MARVLFVEPFYGGSHRAFADGLKQHSRHEIELLTLPDGEWRRRMRRGAQELAEPARQLAGAFDLLVASDMLDLPAFLALTRPKFGHVPVLLYMHENQFTYPRLRGTKLNSWFGQINYLSACAAEVVAFNSEFHRRDFLGALRTLSTQPNNWLLADAIGAIEAKSVVLPVGVELEWLDGHRTERRPGKRPLVLWNHRWEFDKAPETFARVVKRLVAEGTDFGLVLAGEPGPNPSPALVSLAEDLPSVVEHCGYVESREAYARLLWESDIVVSTSRHEFFGVGMVEAMYCECLPLVPARYNYPALVPPELHERCLFETEEEMGAKLREIVTGAAVAPASVRESAARFNWAEVGRQWDEAIAAIVAGSRGRSPEGASG